MHLLGAGIFLPRILPSNTLRRMSDAPEQLDEAYRPVRIALDFREEDVVLLQQIAAFRNELARAQGLRFERNWSRKSLAQSIISAACAEFRTELAPMFDACGAFPDVDVAEAGKRKERASLRKEMADYAKKVLTWQARQAQKLAGKR